MPKLNREIVGIGKKSFFELMNTDACLKIENPKMLVRRPLIVKPLEYPSCETSFFKGNPDETCSWNQVNPEKTFFIGKNDTLWFLYLKQKISIHIVCKKGEIFKELSGTVAIDRECRVKSSFFDLNTHRLSKTNHTLGSPWVFSKLNLSKIVKPRHSNNKLLKEIGTTLKNLNETRKLDLNDILNKFQRSWVVQTTHISFSVVGGVILFTICTILIVYVKLHKKSHQANKILN